MKPVFAFTLLSLASLPFTTAHGVLAEVKIDGKTFKGNSVAGQNRDSAIRRVFSQDPIKGAKNKAINCGVGAKAAKLTVDVRPGSKIEFGWSSLVGSPWPHTTGPMQTYMAKCGDTSCDKFKSGNARWFKISQVGQKDGRWVQQNLREGRMTPAVTIPKNLAPGNYLVRHEIIALHLASSFGGAEFYAGCVQVRVGGSETGIPEDKDLVSIPGTYKDDDPGIFTPNVFQPNFNYRFPGPGVAKLRIPPPPPPPPQPSPPPAASPNNSAPNPLKKNNRKTCQSRVSGNQPREVPLRHRRHLTGFARDTHLH